MIERREILAVASNLGLLPNVVEKDYVLSWVLAGIYAHEALEKSWTFKGGTCLKKCYFETYRFSEDLDFTVSDETHFDQQFLVDTFTQISEWVYEQTGIELPPENLRFDIWTNPRGKPACQGRVSYRGPIAPSGGELPRVKLDLTFDEVLVLPAVERRVSHSYSDDPPEGILARCCYSYEEVFAEKMRALGERARPRDLYDTVYLYRNDATHPSPVVVLDVLKQKCAFKRIEVPTLTSISANRAELDADWASMLQHQLPLLPPVASFWDDLDLVFSWLHGTLQQVPKPIFPIGAGDAVLRAPAGSLVIPGIRNTAPLEIIRFAASNRLRVELEYTDERGRRGTRLIEPYSLRRTSAGDTLLHAVRSQDGGDRTYRVDRINGARISNQTFNPRYAIELTPTGPLSIPPSAARTRIGSARSVGPRLKIRPSGASYIYQCNTCGKRFTHQAQNSHLRKHTNKSGWPCPSRRGWLVETKR